MNVLCFRSFFFSSLSLAVLSMLLHPLVPASHGQEFGPSVDKPRPDGTRWDAARKNLARFQVDKVVGGKRTALKLVAEPAFSFADAVENHGDGTIWFWGRKGRPSAVMQMWTDLPRVPIRNYTFTSLSTSRSISDDRIEARSVSQNEAFGERGEINSIHWTPREIGIEMMEFSNGPKPSSKEAFRLIQMKRIAGSFKSHEMLRERRFELRLMPKPIHRYSDLQTGLIDGAAFLWSRGTDPEALMLIELVKGKAGEQQWQYAFARISHAELHAYFNSKEVWSAPSAFEFRTWEGRRYIQIVERIPMPEVEKQP